MNFPFTTNQFYEIFARYNERVWPAQYFFILLALVCVALLFRPSKSAGRIINAILAFFQAWIGIVYHFVFFSRINPAAQFFGVLFLLEAAIFAWIGVVQGRLNFQYSQGWAMTFGLGLIIYALVVYPLIGYLAGHHYPAVPSFGLPCPTTIFTFGMLFYTKAPVLRIVFITPLLWAAIGSIAAFQLDVYQDLGLLLAGIAGGVGLLRTRDNGFLRKLPQDKD